MRKILLTGARSQVMVADIGTVVTSCTDERLVMLPSMRYGFYAENSRAVSYIELTRSDYVTALVGDVCIVHVMPAENSLHPQYKLGSNLYQAMGLAFDMENDLIAFCDAKYPGDD